MVPWNFFLFLRKRNQMILLFETNFSRLHVLFGFVFVCVCFFFFGGGVAIKAPKSRVCDLISSFFFKKNLFMKMRNSCFLSLRSVK